MSTAPGQPETPQHSKQIARTSLASLATLNTICNTVRRRRKDSQHDALVVPQLVEIKSFGLNNLELETALKKHLYRTITGVC
jgi:hypothetical protein